MRFVFGLALEYVCYSCAHHRQLPLLICTQSTVVTAAALVDPLTGDLTTAQLIDRTEKENESKTVAEHCDRICKNHGVRSKV